MEDEWYDIAVNTHFWLKWRLYALLKQIRQLGIPSNNKLRVLEVGCGIGELRNSIEMSTEWNVDAADLNLDALTKAKPGRGKTLLYDIFDESASLVNSYDIIILFDVLEHIENTKPFIVSLLKHLKPNGHLLINVPAFNMLFSAYDKKMGHFRRYNRKALINEFRKSNLKILDTRYWGLTLFPILVLRTCILHCIKYREETIVKRGFQPPSNWVNEGFKFIARIETNLIYSPPFGTSLLLVGQKNTE